MASRFKSLGFVQMTSLATATALSSIPDRAEAVLIQAESQNIRWRDDGTSPTSTVGMLLATTDEPLFYEGDPADLSVIEVATSASLNVTYFAAVDV